MLAGLIEIQMLADMARLRKDMDEAKGLVGSASKSIAGAAEFAKGALIGIASGLSLHAFTSWMKGAIDAGDAAAKMSQKMGVATSEIAGLELAFKLSGSGTETMVKAMTKLAVAMDKNNEAFNVLGIQTRKADGSLRSSKDVLYQLADAFKAMEDGSLKSALAARIFEERMAGEMIPLLNGGSEGLREMAEMAEKLGLVISEDTAKQSEQFNDTVEMLGMGLQGVARGAMAQMLPALNSLAGGMLSAMTEGDGLKTVADALGVSMKVLYTVFMGGSQAVNTLFKGLGALGAQLVALASGDFKLMMQVGDEFIADVKNDWTKTITNVGSVWDGTAAKTTEAGAKMVRAQKAMAAATAENAEATKKAAAAETKRAEEIRKLIDKIEDSTEAMRFEMQAGEKLTAAQKEALKVLQDLRDGTLKLTEAETIHLATALEAKLATEAQKIETDDLTRAMAAADTLSRKLADSEAARTAGMRQTVVSLIEENEKLRIGEAAWADRQTAVMRATARDLEWQAANEGGNAELAEQARLLRERAELVQDGIVLREAKAAADEWKKTTDSINDGLTDALLRAFESGKGFARAFRDTLVNAFKTLVLQPTIKAIMAPISGAIGGLFGMGNAAAGVPGMAEGGGMLGTLSGLASGFGAFGGSLMAGASWMGAGGSLMGTLGAAGSLIGTGTGAGIGAGLGMGVGALGPIALGLAALSMLDKKATPHVGGYALADPSLNVTDITSVMGGQREDTSQAAVATLVRTVADILNATGGVFGQAPGVSVRGVYESDNNDPGAGLFHLLDAAGNKMAGSFDAVGQLASDAVQGFKQFSDMAAAATLQALKAAGLPDWAVGEFNKLGAGATLDDIQRAAAEVIRMQQAIDNPATDAPMADPLDAPLRAADPSPIWQEMADNAKATAEAAAALLDKAATEETQSAGLAAMIEGFTQTVDRLTAAVASLDAMDKRAAVQAARMA